MIPSDKRLRALEAVSLNYMQQTHYAKAQKPPMINIYYQLFPPNEFIFYSSSFLLLCDYSRHLQSVLKAKTTFRRHSLIY